MNKQCKLLLLNFFFIKS